MHRVVEILLTIGILVNALKGADLMLRPKQQLWIQGKLETLTLWLDYTKPLNWYAKFRSRKIKLILIVVGALLYFSLEVRVLIANYSESTVYWILIRALIISAVTWQLLDRTRKEHPLIKFLLNGQKFTSSLLRPLVIIAVGGVLNLVCLAILVVLYLLYSSGQVTVFIISLYCVVFILGILVTLNIPIVSLDLLAMLSLLIICVSTVLLISEGILKILRGIAWRIVEYTKGAFAAIVLLLTILLGIFELYIKNKGV